MYCSRCASVSFASATPSPFIAAFAFASAPPWVDLLVTAVDGGGGEAAGDEPAGEAAAAAFGRFGRGALCGTDASLSRRVGAFDWRPAFVFAAGFGFGFGAGDTPA